MTNATQKRPGASWFGFPRLEIDVLSFGVLGGQELIAHEWNDRQREEQRHQNGNRQRDRQRSEKLPDYALQQAQWEEHDDSGHGRRSHWPNQLLHRLADRFVPIGVESQVANDVLGDDD